ncbi:hypothetical protein DAI43_22985, partial [Achromobacter xylosoxidans]
SDTDYRSNKWALSHTGRWGWGVSDSYVQQEEFDNRSRQMKIIPYEHVRPVQRGGLIKGQNGIQAVGRERQRKVERRNIHIANPYLTFEINIS